jgi:hypothetical protein
MAYSQLCDIVPNRETRLEQRDERFGIEKQIRVLLEEAKRKIDIPYRHRSRKLENKLANLEKAIEAFKYC